MRRTAILFLILGFYLVMVYGIEEIPIKLVDEQSPNVFSLDTKSTVGGAEGSAVLFDIVHENNRVFGYFVTCYHVLYLSESFELTRHTLKYEAENNWQSEPQETLEYKFSREKQNYVWQLKSKLQETLDRAKVYTEPSCDLVFLVIELPPEWIRSNPILPKQCTDKEFLHKPGVALGFPGYNRKYLTPVLVRDVGSTTSDMIDGLDEDATIEKIRFLTNEPLAQGMSGGAVLDMDGYLMGLIFGRIRDTVNLTISNEDIWKIYKKIKDNKKLLEIYNKSLFLKKPVVSASIRHSALPYKEYRMHWNDGEIWERLIKDMSLFRQQFQEISINLQPYYFTDRAKKFKLRINANFAKYLEENNERLQMWFNGEKNTLSSQNRTFELNLSAGENLLILRKVMESQSGLELGQLLRMSSRLNTLDIWIDWDDKPIIHIFRSLPTLIRDYSIYITIRQQPIEAEILPYNARLAIREDFLTSLLNCCSFQFPLSHQRHTPTFEGTLTFQNTSENFQPEIDKFDNTTIKFNPNQFVSLYFPTTQQMYVNTKTSLKAKKFQAKALGLQMGMENYNASFWLQTNFQFIHSKNSKIYCATRIIYAYTPQQDAFRLPLTKEESELKIYVDLTPFIREFLLSLANNLFLHPNQPFIFFDPEAIKRVYSQPDANFDIQPRQIFFQKDQAGNWWIICTFLIPGQPENMVQPSLLPKNLQTSAELMLKDVPVRVIAPFIEKYFNCSMLPHDVKWEELQIQLAWHNQISPDRLEELPLDSSSMLEKTQKILGQEIEKCSKNLVAKFNQEIGTIEISDQQGNRNISADLKVHKIPIIQNTICEFAQKQLQNITNSLAKWQRKTPPMIQRQDFKAEVDWKTQIQIINNQIIQHKDEGHFKIIYKENEIEIEFEDIIPLIWPYLEQLLLPQRPK